MKKKLVIAIDGPAGAGKSTIAKIVATELKYIYIDTGAMYRALTWKALETGTSFQKPDDLTRLARKTRLTFRPKNGVFHVLADGKDVTAMIRSQQVTSMTNTLAAVQGVRRVLRDLQRQMGRRGGVVMEGRDIGTAVFPNADLKFYLDASPMERARRRYRELRAKNERVSLRAIAEAIRKRDFKDRTRGISPLRVADDAIVVDSTRLTLDQVARVILEKALQSE
ncbi:MAG TPA: (d)CMP kinase [Elusimicrobiota bacterium]|nr:(d)CMP kinase [Elusimicrobiota bacterium]